MEIFRTLYLDAAFCSLQLGLTSFADMSLDEYKTHALGYRSVVKSLTALLAIPLVSSQCVSKVQLVEWSVEDPLCCGNALF